MLGVVGSNSLVPIYQYNMMAFLVKPNSLIQGACCKLYDFDSFKQVHIKRVSSAVKSTAEQKRVGLVMMIFEIPIDNWQNSQIKFTYIDCVTEPDTLRVLLEKL